MSKARVDFLQIHKKRLVSLSGTSLFYEIISQILCEKFSFC